MRRSLLTILSFVIFLTFVAAPVHARRLTEEEINGVVAGDFIVLGSDGTAAKTFDDFDSLQEWIDWLKNCSNLSGVNPKSGPCEDGGDGSGSGSGSGGGGGGGRCSGSVTRQTYRCRRSDPLQRSLGTSGSSFLLNHASRIDTHTFNHIHEATDFEMGSGTAACSSCSGGSTTSGELATLNLTRFHRFRNMTEGSSFGPGVFSNFDIRLELFQVNASNKRVNLFDPSELYGRQLKDGGSTANPHDGVYIDEETESIRELRLYDDAGLVTSNISLSDHAELEYKNGIILDFDIFDASGAEPEWSEDLSRGRVIRLNGNHYLRVAGYKGILGNQPRTIASWIRTSKTGSICYWGKNTATNKFVFRVQADNGKAGAIRVEVNGGYIVGNQDIRDGKWHHVAAVVPDGATDVTQVKLFVDGQLQGTSASLSKAINTASGVDFTLGDNQSGWRLDGDLDETRLYSRALTDLEVADLSAGTDVTGSLEGHWLFDETSGSTAADASANARDAVCASVDPEWRGRLTGAKDRNGYGYQLTYRYDLDDPNITQAQIDEINASPSRQWQIHTITDAYANTTTLQCHPTQVSGRWVVSQIDVPGGQSIHYTYADGFLSTVEHPDQSVSAFGYGATTNGAVIEYDDPAASVTHQRKRAFLTTSVYMDGTDTGYKLYNQSALMILALKNFENEVLFLVASKQHTNLNYRFVYSGGGRLGHQRDISEVRYYDNWSIDPTKDGYASFSGTAEPAFASYRTDLMNNNKRDARLGRPANVQDDQGRLHQFTYNADGAPTQHTYTDGSAEQVEYNAFNQVTRQQDRAGRVSKYTYDARGNRLTEEVGLLHDPATGQDVTQPEHAIRQWEYYPEGHQNEFLLRYAFDPLGNRTEHVYDANNRLIEIREPDDEGTGYHTAKTVTYDTAGRVATTSDALNRTATYTYDSRSRVVKITYQNNTTEETLYGTTGIEAGLVLAQKDRGGAVAINRYDTVGRRIEVVRTADHVGSTATILAGYTPPVAGSYLPEASVTTYTYLDGTNNPLTVTNDGNTTEFVYDYRHRVIETHTTPSAGETLIAKKTYVDNQLFSTEDPYGRKTYHAYRAADNTPIRVVKGTVPEFSLADFTATLNLVRDDTPNATYLITDSLPNAEGQHVEIIDPRGVVQATVLDSRGRVTHSIAAAAKLGEGGYLSGNIAASGVDLGSLPAHAAISQTVYDSGGQTIESRSPRYFDASDTLGYQKSSDIYTYTRRGLRKTHTTAAGASDYVDPDDAAWTPDAVRVTESWTYNLDGKLATHTDFGGNTRETLYSPCCGHVTSTIGPTGTSQNRQYDAAGRVTYTETTSGPNTYSQSTTRFDVTGRPTARTVWLTVQTTIDPQNPPIAGLNNIPSTEGLTTRYYHDDDLTDGMSITVPRLDGSGNYTIDLTQLLTEFTTDLGTNPISAEAPGSASITINPNDEISVSISAGQASITAILDQTSTPLTWTTAKPPVLAQITGYGTCLSTTRVDALNNATTTLTDAAGRTLQTLDALNNATVYTYDASGNRRTVRDPNNIGQNTLYDHHSRPIQTADTQQQSESTHLLTTYNATGNILTQTDAKNAVTTNTYDALGRHLTQTDRLGGITSRRYDHSNNLRHLCDADNQTPYQPTRWTYSARNQKLTEAFPGHTGNLGDPTYDLVSFQYSPIGRLTLKTDQQGDTTQPTYDLAGRLVTRDYTGHPDSPLAGQSDTDTFTYSPASRILSATSGRYNNTITFTHDPAGRRLTESLTVNFGTPQTYTVGSSHDAAGRRTQITYPDGTTVTRSYTERDQLSQIVTVHGVEKTDGY